MDHDQQQSSQVLGPRLVVFSRCVAIRARSRILVPSVPSPPVAFLSYSNEIASAGGEEVVWTLVVSGHPSCIVNSRLGGDSAKLNLNA